MKLQIGNYEIEVKARFVLNEKPNEEDTLDFLNHLSIVFNESATLLMEKFKQDETKKFYKGSAMRRAEEGDAIFEYCRARGLYDQKN